jgi:hypothetical protein
MPGATTFDFWRRPSGNYWSLTTYSRGTGGTQTILRGFTSRSRKCAEVLVPDRVESRYIIGAYVVDITAAKRLSAQGFALPVAIDSDLFFR